jgi:hypothetical protein
MTRMERTSTTKAEIKDCVEQINQLGEIFGGYSGYVTVSYQGRRVIIRVAGTAELELSLSEARMFLMGMRYGPRDRCTEELLEELRIARERKSSIDWLVSLKNYVKGQNEECI